MWFLSNKFSFIFSFPFNNGKRYNKITPIHNVIVNGINLLAAFIARVPVRISHSHNTNSAHARSVGATLPIRIYRKVMRSIINTLSTRRLGCSKAANLYMYGEKAKDTVVINNGVDFN